MNNNSITNDSIIKNFIEESLEIIDNSTNNLLKLENNLGNSKFNIEIVNKLFRGFHSLKGCSSYLNFSVITKITRKIENILDDIRKNINNLDNERILLLHTLTKFLKKMLSGISEKTNDKAFKQEAIVLLNYIDSIYTNDIDGSENDIVFTPALNQYINLELDEILKSIENSLYDLADNPHDTKKLEILFNSIHSFKNNANFLGYVDTKHLNSLINQYLEKIKQNKELFNKDFIHVIIHLLEILKNEMEIKKFWINKGLPINYSTIDNLFCSVNTKIKDNKKQNINRELNKINQINDDIDSNKNIGIKVNVDRINELIENIDELTIIKNNFFSKDEFQNYNFDYESSLFDRIIYKLKNIGSSMRMIPISIIFDKMNLLVKELSQKTQKEIIFKTSGNNIEIDKDIIDEIAEPIMHLIRNAVDHGIETAEERTNKKKIKKAILKLFFKEESGQVSIVVSDDGKGFDKKAIVKKAHEKGLLEDINANLTDTQIFDFIFIPGFSTSSTVNDISGRGVGLDVVKKKVEDLSGSIHVESIEDKGTTFNIKIPSKFLYGMLVKISKEKYLIPINIIKESISSENENAEISFIKDKKFIKLKILYTLLLI